MAMETWLLYLGAVIGLSLTPGPNSLLALTHGALHGHRRTLLTITGGSLGFVLLIAMSMLGIGALLKASANALLILKLVGGAYLIWLGVQLWRAPAPDLAPLAPGHRGQAAGTLLRQGFLAAVSNPKVLLFYGAFLPQFIDPARPLAGQFVLMAATFAIVEFAVEYLLARLAHRIRPWLQRVGRRFNKTCGGLFMLMGVALPATR
ncbi:MAG: LysE family transporter [Rhodocyclaceae bacterium]|nr:LysE family transporter [Rhodocyclaceae bacterium]